MYLVYILKIMSAHKGRSLYSKYKLRMNRFVPSATTCLQHPVIPFTCTFNLCVLTTMTIDPDALNMCDPLTDIFKVQLYDKK